jgi:UDP-glucose 4-epimerase
LCDSAAINLLFRTENKFDAVIHFAAFKAVGESMRLPLKYFRNNLVSLMNLLDVMQVYQCRNIVFSSSATVYGAPDELPVKETTPFKKALSAYGSTKQMGEEILEKIAGTGSLNVISLRYFNPVGAHPSGLIGELPLGRPNNLMPFVTQTAIGKQEQLTVYGNDYETPDGTCVRDYIHVVDLAKAHVKSCDKLLSVDKQVPFDIYNIGTGFGISVLEIIKCFEKENRIKLKYVIGERRYGDAAAIYADVTKASEVLNWKAEKTLADMVTDSWRWEKQLGGIS